MVTASTNLNPPETDESDESDVMQRRYVHGTRQIDERAIPNRTAHVSKRAVQENVPANRAAHVSKRVLPSRRNPLPYGRGSVSATLDTYYYLVRELGTVAGLIKRNGTLVEANTYDAYGKVKQWGYRDFDFNRDGDVDSGDETVFGDAYSGSGVPTANPTADFDMDGDVDGSTADGDQLAFNNAVTAPNAPPLTLFTSALGNPYHFTGRRLYMLEDQPCTGICPAAGYNVQIQHNRARFYKPDDGRWLNRDPLGYVDGMNLYEYVVSCPHQNLDPSGRRRVSFKFAAFIGNTFPKWIDEPAGFLYEFSSDGRPFGQAGTSRLSSTGSVESEKLGFLNVESGFILTEAGESHRRNKLTGSISSKTAPTRKSVDLSNDKLKCRSEFLVVAAAAYPFTSVAPDIDYTVRITFQVIRKGVILATISGVHDSFPDYEALVDGVLGYGYPTADPGPTLGNLSSLNPGVKFSRQWLVIAPTRACCPEIGTESISIPAVTTAVTPPNVP